MNLKLHAGTEAGEQHKFLYKYRINALFYQKNPAWIRKVEGCIFFCIDALFRKNYNKIIRTKNLYFHTGYENIC